MPQIEPLDLLNAYCEGVFPMGDDDGSVSWYRPKMRGILPIADFHLPTRFERYFKHHPFEVRWNTAFGDVVRACADRPSSWINETILETPSGRRVALGQVAEVLDTTGPSTLNREHVQRRIVVFCNVQGRDLASVVTDIKKALAPVEENLRQLPGSYYLEYSGQFEAQQEANRRLAILGTLSILGVFLLLCKALDSWRAALQVLVNIPLAAFGSVLTLLIVNHPTAEALTAAPWWDWPRVWISATSLSVAHWVGFITLIGVVSRNGIMMISHYIHLMQHEGEAFSEQMIVRGSLERLAPVMMTAMTSFIGLLPLLFGAGQTGKEILYPLALVVFGGMLTSTILDQVVTPALFFKFGHKVYEHSPPTIATSSEPETVVTASATPTPTNTAQSETATATDPAR